MANWIENRHDRAQKGTDERRTWDILSRSEGAPAEEEAAKYSEFMARGDRVVNRSIIIVFDWRPRRSLYCTCMAETFWSVSEEIISQQAMVKNWMTFCFKFLFSSPGPQP